MDSVHELPDELESGSDKGNFDRKKTVKPPKMHGTVMIAP